MEINTGLIACATAYGGKDLIIRVLGPSADYWGEGLKNFNEKIVNNIKKICAKAHFKLGPDINDTDSVPPRVAKDIFENGGMCEDELLIEYYSGLLASSRTDCSRDDRVLSLLGLLRTMSTYQIRSHYIIYSIFRSKFIRKEVNLQVASEASKLAVFIPINVYANAMEFNGSENLNIILPHSLNTLSLNNLIGNNYFFGDQNFLLKQFPDNQIIKGAGIIVTPSPIGAELYLAIQGKRECTVNDIFSDKWNLNTSINIQIDSGSEPIYSDQNAMV